MEFNNKYYDNGDLEKGIMWHDMDKAVRREMAKQERPKTKPAEVFEGFKENKKTKRKCKCGHKMKYTKEDVKDYRK